MKYLGGKKKIAKYIAYIINTYHPNINHYYEMFCGMCSVGLLVNAKYKHFSDAFKPNISLLNAIKEGVWQPPDEFPLEKYNEYMRHVKEVEKSGNKYELEKLYNNPLTSYVGFGLSFGAKYFGGFARNKAGNNDNSKFISSTNEWINLIRLGNKFVNADFKHADYRTILPTNSVIYLDPPYIDTTALKQNKETFNHDEFYNYCDELVKRNNQVFISEYFMPSDRFTLIAEFHFKQTMAVQQDKGVAKTERLYVPRSTGKKILLPFYK